VILKWTINSRDSVIAAVRRNQQEAAMPDQSTRDDAYCTALEQIKQMVAKYRPDGTTIQSNAIFSPRILMLSIERSEGQIPADIFGKLHPLAEALLNKSELGIAQMVGVPEPDDVQNEVQTQVRSVYEAIRKLHAEVMESPQQGGEREPPMTRVLKSMVVGGGPVSC